MSDSTRSTMLVVHGHRVPVTAYKRIVELWRSGWTESEIIQEAMSTMRNNNIATISEVVWGAINDQKFAAAFTGDPACGNYFRVPLNSPETIQQAQLALQKVKANLARAESKEDESVLEVRRLMEIRPSLVGGAKTHTERMARQAHIDQMTKKALQNRQKAEDDVLHLKEVEKIRRRLLALSLC